MEGEPEGGYPLGSFGNGISPPLDTVGEEEYPLGVLKSHEEMPIFTRSFDLLTWLLPVTNNFPRAHRGSVTRRLLDAAFDFRERIEEANVRQGSTRRERLIKADEALARLRVYLRLACRWGWLTDGQYGHAAELVAEIGRLLGGWQKATHS